MDSKASKHLDWCLNKAGREVEDCKKRKKKISHRGLLKIEPDKKLALGHLQKARHNLEAFRILRKNKFSDWSITAGFYTLYHCFLAIAIKYGYESKNQTCTIALIETLQEQGKISINQDIIDSKKFLIFVLEFLGTEILKKSNQNFCIMKYDEDENNHEHSIIELREDYTYGIDLEVNDKEQLDRIEKLCVEFIDSTKNIIYDEKNS